MNCHEITERLDAWLDGELEGPDAVTVEQHVADCGDCGTLVEERTALSTLLRDALVLPAEIAAREGRFDGLWDRIEARIAEVPSAAVAAARNRTVEAEPFARDAYVLQPQPIPAPSLWKRVAVWWAERFEQRQAWVPALAAAAALVIMVALIADRKGTGEGTPGASPSGASLVAEAPTSELPPFAEPRLAGHDGAPESQRHVAGGEAPRRRDAEEMVARNNEAFVVSYEVDRGIVLIEQPDGTEQPMVVWHLMPEDNEGAEGDEDSI